MAVTATRDTGHGASVTFGTTSWSGKLKQIPTSLQQKAAAVEITHLGSSTNKEYMAGDLADLNEITLDVAFETKTGLPSRTTTPETVTVTFPLAPGGGGVTAANIAGTAVITGVEYPPMATGQQMIGKIFIQYTGATGPTYTAES